ncbi:MAG: 2-succinyl-6-hydroxy-2,4-cyclohexadiene-1-carboxylate synthase [candidate division Zixibacteria bacterium]|nr:2-succinyl-6-hydroxy-2,4-cyclohexadiene-1-carboxylate synthase [candidate division Zixibacteria bacterium]
MESPHKFHYITFGARGRPALLFLHGFLGSSRDWHSIAAKMSDKFFCIVPDLPGHGKSIEGVPDVGYRMENCAESIVELLDFLQIGTCRAAAYSMGGRLALYMVVRYPERFERVVIESASPGLEGEQERRERLARDRRLAERLRCEPLDAFLAEWYGQPLFDSLRSDRHRFEELLARRFENDPVGLALSLEYMGTGAQPSLWEELNRIRMPLLLIAGEKDSKFVQTAQRMATRLPAATVGIVSGAGHNVHFEKTDEYIKLIRLFL